MKHPKFYDVGFTLVKLNLNFNSMFSKSYYSVNSARQNLACKVQQKIEVINQDISIRDLYLLPKDFESIFLPSIDSKRRPREFWIWLMNFPNMIRDNLERLNDHVAILAEITNRYHQQAYCEQTSDGTYTLRQDSFNKITRLLLPEFSLYGAQPLSEKDFNNFYNNLLSIAATKTENVHLLLSSLPVLNEDKKVLNVCLYVECGPNPVITIICKARASSVDPEYLGTTNFSQQSNDLPTVITSYVLSKNGNVITNLSIFKVRTKGGAEYIQAIDICLDHFYAHSKTLLGRELLLKQQGLYPAQIDQTVSSSSIALQRQSQITSWITHVDSELSKKAMLHHNTDTPVRSLDFDDLKTKKYPDFVIVEMESGVELKQPIFGRDLLLFAEKERKMDLAPTSLNVNIKKQNKNACRLFIDTQLQSRPDFQEVIQNISENHVDLVTKINQFYLETANLCKPSSFDNFLRLEINRVKTQIKTLIDKSYAKYTELQDDQLGLFFDFPSILDEFEIELKLCHNFKSNLIQNINKKIQELRLIFEKNHAQQLDLDQRGSLDLGQD